MAPAGSDESGRAREHRFIAEVENVSRSIRDPAAKLRYLRASLAAMPAQSQRPRSGAPGRARSWLGRTVPAPAAQGRGLGVATPAASPGQPSRVARSMAIFAAASVLVAVLGAVTAGFQGPARIGDNVAVAAPAPKLALPSVAEDLPQLPAGVLPKAVWLVERGDGYELHSNGLRIDTTFAVEGTKRRFRAFLRARGMDEAIQERPVGILFHTTESDIWPLEAGFNENLRDSTHRLLRYLSREHVYHYLIDRFGRVWRVVSEDAKANHAGNSVWAEGDHVYLSLNNAFLGVSFETRWDGGRALPITEAQLTSGRNLTEYLRQRYAIAPEMCTAHGLVSVNPKQRLIGHHLDWSRGFPFAAFGLPDQYERAAASVADFGFRYDEKLVAVLGEPWPGVRAAEAALVEEARRSGRGVDDVRREKQELFDVWQSEQAHDEQLARAGSASPRSVRASGG
jgi:hypothetical protein